MFLSPSVYWTWMAPSVCHLSRDVISLSPSFRRSVFLTLFAAYIPSARNKCILLFIPFACDFFFIPGFKRLFSWVVVFSRRCILRLAFHISRCLRCTSSNIHAHDIVCISCVPDEQKRARAHTKLLFPFVRLSTCFPWLHAFNISFCVFDNLYFSISFYFELFSSNVFSPLHTPLRRRQCDSLLFSAVRWMYF